MKTWTVASFTNYLIEYMPHKQPTASMWLTQAVAEYRAYVYKSGQESIIRRIDKAQDTYDNAG